MPLSSATHTSQQTAQEFTASMRRILPGFAAEPLNKTWTCHARLAIEPDAALLLARFSDDWCMTYEASGDCLAVFVPVEGGSLHTGSSMVPIGVSTGQALVLTGSKPQPIVWRAEPELHSATLMFSQKVVRSVLESAFNGADLNSLNLAPVLDLTSEAGRHFRQLSRVIVAAMVNNRVRPHAPLTFGLMLEAALCLLFDRAPNNFRCQLDLVETALPRHVRRAIDFMRANLHNPITVAEIAAASGASLRSLQCGFSQHCNVSPREYLRKLRLDAAHCELTHPANTLPVREVAEKWGFSHFGRFAAHYKQAYGMSPSQTQRAQTR